MDTHKLTYTQSDIHTHAPAHNKHARIGNNNLRQEQTHIVIDNQARNKHG